MSDLGNISVALQINFTMLEYRYNSFLLKPSVHQERFTVGRPCLDKRQGVHDMSSVPGDLV